MRSRKPTAGYTLIELMLVVAILAVLGSIASPRLDLVLQKANQAAAKNNLGSIRSTISLYYSEMEGRWPLSNAIAGYQSLSPSLAPKYIEKLPTPKVLDRVGGFNSLSLNYDSQAAYHMSQTPPEDVVVLYGTQGPAPFADRPFVYDPSVGLIYMCNDNYDTTGTRFYEW